MSLNRQTNGFVERSLFLLLPVVCLVAKAFGASATGPAAEPQVPVSPRDFYNAGTVKLQEGKLREAESLLEAALASQNDRLQPPALYNLGHVRFGQGVEQLKKGPEAGPTNAHGRAAADAAQAAAQDADQALASNDVQKMVASYLRGRGARKELKAAIKAVQRALETHGTALTKWQRSEDDFKSTVQLRQSDADARQNADTVDRCIAKLIDSIREMQQTMGMMGRQNQNLGEKLKQLKGNIPAPDMPPGAAGDDEDDEEMPNGPQEGQKEGATKEGEEMKLSPEQASWLLEAFKLDSERRLPMGQQTEAEPKDRYRPTW